MIITGEKIQELTDHTIITYGQYYADEQLKRINCQYTYFDKNQPVKELSNNIQNAKSIFVYTHILDFFFEKIYPLRKDPFVLVTHNSDEIITNQYIKYLNDFKIKKWFAQSINVIHPKLIAIPAGLANSQWPHGNLKLFNEIMIENNPKNNLIYKNFNIDTSENHRSSVARQTPTILLTRNRTQIDYWRDISSSLFNICPMGNGIDSHRVWESLYLKSIPIITNCINNNGYSELPILSIPIDGWNIITPNFLYEKHKEIQQKKHNYEKLDLNYWREQIKNG